MTKAMKNRAYQELKSNAGILEKGGETVSCWADKQGNKGSHEETVFQREFRVLFRAARYTRVQNHVLVQSQNGCLPQVLPLIHQALTEGMQKRKQRD